MDIDTIFKVSSLLTNTDKENRALYEKAIKEYKNSGGELGIYINHNAFDDRSRPIKGYISIHTHDKYKDHAEFWDVFDKVKKYQEIVS